MTIEQTPEYLAALTNTALALTTAEGWDTEGVCWLAMEHLKQYGSAPASPAPSPGDVGAALRYTIALVSTAIMVGVALGVQEEVR